MNNMNTHPMKIITSKERYKIVPGKIVEIFGNHFSQIFLYPDIETADRFPKKARTTYFYRMFIMNNFPNDLNNLIVSKSIRCIVLNTYKNKSYFILYDNVKPFKLQIEYQLKQTDFMYEIFITDISEIHSF